VSRIVTAAPRTRSAVDWTTSTGVLPGTLLAHEATYGPCNRRSSDHGPRRPSGRRTRPLLRRCLDAWPRPRRRGCGALHGQAPFCTRTVGACARCSSLRCTSRAGSNGLNARRIDSGSADVQGAAIDRNCWSPTMNPWKTSSRSQPRVTRRSSRSAARPSLRLNSRKSISGSR
jgi:hypothetical protein